MKIYLLQNTGTRGYDTFSSCVVFAESKAKARRTHPVKEFFWDEKEKRFFREAEVRAWDLTVFPPKEYTEMKRFPDVSNWWRYERN